MYKKTVLITLVLLAVLIMPTAVSAAFYSDPAVVNWSSPEGTEVISYTYPSEPNPYCTDFGCSATVSMKTTDGIYLGCYPESSGAIIGHWILGYPGGSSSNATSSTYTNACPENYYMDWMYITGNGTSCHGGIQCYDMQIFASWKTILQPPPMVASYACDNTTIAPGSALECHDTSTNNPIDWNWTLSYPTGATWGSVGSSSISHILSDIGSYSVHHCAASLSQNACVNGTITVSASAIPTPPSYVVVNLDVKDAFTGALIHDSPVGIRNVTSGVWRNSTSPTGLVYFDSTGPAFEYPLSVGENITLAASPSGYQEGSVSFAIPYHNYKAYLNLVPLTTINATGAFTLVVTVVNNKNGLPITGASITLDTGDMKNSNSAGAATFRNVTAGTRSVTVASPPGQGYGTAVQSATGSSGETKMITVQLVREGETPVATPVSPTPTTTISGNYTTGALNDQGSIGLMQMMEQIIRLWPVVFLMGFIYFARKTLGG